MKNGLSAVAFDLDGTLYPNYRFNVRLFWHSLCHLPLVVSHLPFFAAFGLARRRMRKERAAAPDVPFYRFQAEIMARRLRWPPDLVQKKVDDLIYRGWEPIFRRVKMFPYMRETLEAFREAGLKLALLSDFPVIRKLEIMGIGDLWDESFSTEDVGRLKPDPLPFLELSRRLGLPPERILYVGNSASYDAAGAKGVGMMTALVVKRFAWRAGSADFYFHDYRQLRDYVLS